MIYEPNRGDDFKKTFKTKTLIVQFPRDDLTALYRWFVKKKYLLELQAPMFGAHVTVVRGDEHPPNRREWKKYQGQKITVDVNPHMYRSYGFWALPVQSKRCHEIRYELGLKNYHSLHLTVGREYPEDKKRYWSQKQLNYLKEPANVNC